jgi:O-antigen/teichoic acid export membrane protein
MTDRSNKARGTGAGNAMLKYAPSRFVEPLLSLVSLPILTRALDADQYGHLSVLLLTAGLIRNVAFDWIGNCALRFRSLYSDDLDRFFANIVAGLAMSIGVGALVIFPLKAVLSDGALMIVGAYLWWLFADAVFSGLAFCGEMVLRATHRPVAFTMSRVFQGLSRHVVALVGLVLFTQDFSSYFVFRIAGLVLICVWSWLTIDSLKHLHWRRVSLTTQKEFFRFGFPLTVVLLANALRVIANRYVVLWLDGPENTGLYSAAVNIGSAPLLVFQQVVMLGLYPLAIDAWDKGQSIIPIVRDGMRYYFLASIPALVGMALLAKPILALVAGPQYAPAWPVLALLAGAMFAFGLSQYFSLQFMVAKRTGVMATIGLVTGILNVVLSIGLVARFGYLAAAFGTIVANLMLLLAMMIWGVKPWHDVIPWRAVVHAVGAATVMAAVIIGLKNVMGIDTILQLVLAVLVGAGIYGVVLWRTGELPGNFWIKGL